MSKSPYVFAAHSGTKAIILQIPEDGLPEDDRPIAMQAVELVARYCSVHPIVGWEVCGTWAVPLYPYPINPQFNVAILLPNGEIADVELRENFVNLAEWSTAVLETIHIRERTPENISKVPAEVADAPGITSRLIDDIGLTGRAKAPLKREDITVVTDFGNYSSDEIATIRGITAKALKDIRAAMEIEGINFTDETPEPSRAGDFSDIL